MDQTKALPIPSPARTADGRVLDPLDISQTPGGTIFGTTPGGTRIIYDRDSLLFIRRSPLASTPPKFDVDIPGVTSPPKKKEPKCQSPDKVAASTECNPSHAQSEDLFNLEP
mmetsp:Transcript_52573/g.132228  ORF Transcript_52573/g.132228 Transcript_52573/m.132228 type:complete len:112 (-) Transcript_52573:164-499(-)